MIHCLGLGEDSGSGGVLNQPLSDRLCNDSVTVVKPAADKLMESKS